MARLSWLTWLMASGTLLPGIALAAAPDTASPTPAAGSRRAATSIDEDEDGDKDEDEQAAAKSKKAASEPGEGDRSFSHGGQVGLRVAFVTGYRMSFRYPDSPFCREPEPAKGNDQQKFCGFGAPPALDVALGWAPIGFIEPFVWARFGLAGESPTNTQPAVQLGAGARMYATNDGPFKVFIEPAIGLGFEKGAGNDLWNNRTGFVTQTPVYKQDLLFHIGAGPQYDFSKGFGIYGQAGLTAGVLRSMSATMELHFGVQARFP